MKNVYFEQNTKYITQAICVLHIKWKEKNLAIPYHKKSILQYIKIFNKTPNIKKYNFLYRIFSIRKQFSLCFMTK